MRRKSSCYSIKLRRIIGLTPAGGVDKNDIFILEDIGRRKFATVVDHYAKQGLHVLHMYPIPHWEGEKS